MINRIKKIYYDNKEFFIIFGLIIVFVFFFWITGIGCPIKFLTGISCAGCGMTRAWWRLFHLDFSGAFYYHPLFPLPIAVAVVVFLKRKINTKVYITIMIAVIVLFMAVYFYRILNPEDLIIVFEPEKGFLFNRKLLHSF